MNPESIVFVIWAILTFLLIIGVIWFFHPFKAMTWFYHGLLGWHKPDGKMSFDGANICSRCRFCGKKIMQDSQGNWFTYE